MKINPNDICDHLASRVDSDYKFVRFKGCLFNVATDELISTFLYEESIKGKITSLKPRLEQEFKTSVGLDLQYLFLYKQCYMDSGRLEILLAEFLRNNFSFLTLDLEDEDILVTEGFTVRLRLTKQAADYIKGSKAWKGFVDDLTQNNFALFNFVFEEKSSINQKELTLEDIEKFAEKQVTANVIDKVFKITDREYLLGTPIKERPIKIEFLKVSPESQVIAGTISFFTKREFTKKNSPLERRGGTEGDGVVEQKMPYWTFVLDDGNRKQSCVYFPSSRTEETHKKNIEKMESLGDGRTICVIGVNDERNGRVNFNVRGISTCALSS